MASERFRSNRPLSLPFTCGADTVRPPPKIAGERTVSLRQVIGQGYSIETNPSRYPNSYRLS